MRVGCGWDSHRLTAGRKLILGGVEIPHDTGLLGHSDADVLIHAVIDALLGAAHLGDIGRLFPDTDPAFAGADSLALLKTVCDRLQAAGWRIGNVDCVLQAQAPKLAPYISAMEENLALVMGVSAEAVSVKAKTAEGLGPVGNRESMEAWAVALLEKVHE